MRTVDAKTLRKWLDNDEAVLVDVREPAEYHSENITGAKLIPLSTLNKGALPEHSGKKLVIHCRKGGRGGSACQKLQSEAPDMELYNLEGGIESWVAEGFTVNSSGKPFMSVDRQVQLTIGVCVIVGSLLAYFVNPLFVLMTGFFGAGLTFAGLTGFCGLALVMAKMPWNRA